MYEATVPSFGLCDFKEVISATNGSLLMSKGSDCTRIILAPRGWRIKFTLYEIANADAITYIHDGATTTGTLEKSYSRNEALDKPKVFYSTSNALLVHTDRISSDNTKFNASFEMLPHKPVDKCACLPTVDAETTCEFAVYDKTGEFYSDNDELKKECTTSCDTGLELIRFGPYYATSIDMTCRLHLEKPDSTWQVDESGYPGSKQLFDTNLISCTKAIPAAQVLHVYALTYPNISCDRLDKSTIENGIDRFLVSNQSDSYVGECFKEPRTNCTAAKPVLAICTSNQNRVKIEIQDNVQMTGNETATRELFKKIFDSKNNIKVKNYVLNELVVNNTVATDFNLFIPYTTSVSMCPEKYGNQLDHSCILCPLHTYTVENNVHYHNPCRQCPPFQRRLHNESTCVNGTRGYPEPSDANCLHKCSVGKFFNNESGICDWCDYGYFQNSTSVLNPVCHPCPAGNTTTFVGATSERDCMYQCRKGQFSKHPSCLDCAVGYYMPYEGNQYPQCYKCPLGNTTLKEGTANQTGCVDQCSVGKYFNITQGACLLCPNNTYQDEEVPGNKLGCKTCPANSVTLSTGATSINSCLGPCSIGEYLDIKPQVPSCKQCPQNTYNDKGNRTLFMCMACPKHKITKREGAHNISQCIYTCSKGEFFNVTGEICEKCPRGTFQDEDGQGSCKPCAGETFTLKTGSKTCISPCKYGELLNKSAEACQKCPVGYFQGNTNHRSTICMPCPLDHYTDKRGAHNCTACPNGEITVMTAATNRPDCIERCGRGYYLNKTLRSCQMCLKGFYQDQAGYRNESCVKCASANLTTLASGAQSAEECVGYCASSPCLNGAKCTNIDMDFNCTCSKHLSGKRCENIVDSKMADQMEIQVTFPDLVWNNNLSDPESRSFIELANQIENAIRDEFKNASTFRTVKVEKFTRRSVISYLVFNYVPGVEFSNPLDTLAAVTVDGKLGNLTVNSSSLSVVNYTCGSPLGMENGRIPDDALTSANPVNVHPFTNARLHHNGSGWTPRVTNIEDAYLQVDFGEVVLLTGIATQGSSYQGGNWLLSYYFSYSKDGKTWLFYKGNTNDEYMVGSKSLYTHVSLLFVKLRIKYMHDFCGKKQMIGHLCATEANLFIHLTSYYFYTHLNEHIL